MSSAFATWSSASRLNAVAPHSPFALPLDSPKQPNPLSDVEAGDMTRYANMNTTTMDFARTIPLSQLIAAEEEQLGDRAATTHGRTGTLSRSATFSSTSTGLLNRTQSASFSPNARSSMHTPLVVPPSRTYTASLDAVHMARSDRLQRLPSGWSQSAFNRRMQQRAEEKEERIAVYDSATYEELMEEAKAARRNREQDKMLEKQQRQHRRTLISGGGRPNTVGSVASLSSTFPDNALASALDARSRAAARAAHSRSKLRAFWSEVASAQQRNAAKLAARIERQQRRDEEKFKEMIDRLENNKELMAEINDYIALHDAADEQRKEKLYAAWCESVYGQIHSAIQQCLADRPTAEIEARRQKLFDDFLRLNKSQTTGLADECVSENGYNPLEARRYALRVHTGGLRDPLKSKSQQHEDEWKIYKQFHPDADRIEHAVKDMLAPPIWASSKIEATPHGRYSVLKGGRMQPVGKKTPKDGVGVRDSTGVRTSFDHYDIDTNPATVNSQYWNRGGKRVEGYDRTDKVDYNIVASTEPSYTVLFSKYRHGQQPQTQSDSQRQFTPSSQQQPQSLTQPPVPPTAPCSSLPPITTPPRTAFVPSPELAES